MTFGEAKKAIEEFLAEHKDAELKDVAQILMDKQEEFDLTDLDLGILLVSIGGEEFLPEGAIKALEEEGFFEGEEEGKAEEKSEEPEEKPEEEKEESSEDDEKEEVRKMYDEAPKEKEEEEVEDEKEEVEDEDGEEKEEKEEIRKMYSGE